MKAPENTSVQEVIKRMDEQYQKYRFMEANLAHKKRRCVCHCDSYVREHAHTDVSFPILQT